MAKSDGELGKAATAKLVKLDLSSNPGAYIRSGCSADSSGDLIVSIRNDTTVEITGIAVAVVYTDASGRQQQPRFSINGRVAPGQVASVNTGLGPYTDGSNCPAQVVAIRAPRAVMNVNTNIRAIVLRKRLALTSNNLR